MNFWSRPRPYSRRRTDYEIFHVMLEEIFAAHNQRMGSTQLMFRCNLQGSKAQKMLGKLRDRKLVRPIVVSRYRIEYELTPEGVSMMQSLRGYTTTMDFLMDAPMVKVDR